MILEYIIIIIKDVKKKKKEYCEKGEIVSSLNINKKFKNAKKSDNLQKQINLNIINYFENEEYEDLK